MSTAADHLRAISRALRADAEERAATLDAIADRLDATGDELLDAPAVEAEYRIKFRRVTDAATRGELEIVHAGRKPLVRRSVIDAWIASRATKAPAAPIAANDTTDRAEARASIERAAARMGSTR